MTPALLSALDATTGRTWHADDYGAHATGWLWRLQAIGTDLDLTTGTMHVATITPDPDPWTTAERVADAIAAHVSQVGQVEEGTP